LDIEGVSRRKGHTEVTDFIAGGSTEPDFQACAHDPKVQRVAGSATETKSAAVHWTKVKVNGRKKLFSVYEMTFNQHASEVVMQVLFFLTPPPTKNMRERT